METILPAYKAVGERRYRETSGLYWEDFELGDVFEHRPGRTVLDVDYRPSSWSSPEEAGRAARAVLPWVDVVIGNEDEVALLTGTRDPRDQVRAVLLDREDADQKPHGERDDVRIEHRRRDRQPFDGAEHGDRGRDHPVAIEQRGAEDAEQDERHVRAPAAQVGSLDQRDQGHVPALAVV